MLICVVRNYSLSKFVNNVMPGLQKVDLVLFSYNTIKKANYEDEILGKTNHIKTFLNISKQLNCVVCAGAYFELVDKTYSSIIVCEKGELLGVTDSLLSNGKNKVKDLKLYVTKIGNINILVNDDLLNKKQIASVLKLNPDLIINISDEVSLKTYNEYLQKQNFKPNESILCLTNNALLYKEKFSSEIKLNFCEFFTKELKI